MIEKVIDATAIRKDEVYQRLQSGREILSTTSPIHASETI